MFPNKEAAKMALIQCSIFFAVIAPILCWGGYAGFILHEASWQVTVGCLALYLIFFGFMFSVNYENACIDLSERE